MLNAPNSLTLLRFALVPVLAVLLLERHDDWAFVLFVVSALSDLADGLIARHWNLRTRFGAIAHPLADKLTMLTVAVVLTLQNALPWWFALALISRDLLIVGGSLSYHLVIGHVEMAPSALSKLNTALEFVLLLSVLAIRAGLVRGGAWMQLLLPATLATIALSAVHYVVVWGRKAAQARKPPV